MTRSKRQAQAVSYPDMASRRRNNPTVIWSITTASVVILVLAIVMPLWFPRMVRSLIPDRYIVAYAPAFFQDIVYSSNEGRAAPTAMPVDVQDEQQLIEQQLTSLSTPEIPVPTVDFAAGVDLPPTSTVEEEPTPIINPSDTGTVQDYVLLTGFEYQNQGWNQCGPATMGTYLSFFGLGGRRDDISETVKPHYEDSNVRPDELANYAANTGLGAKVLINGDLETLKKLVSAGYPVMIERGFDELPDLEWMGHYMLLIGYSESNREFYALDAYWGAPSRRDGDADFPVDTWSYARINELWRHFNRTYIIVYQPYQEQAVASIIGPDFDHSTMLANALVTAQSEAALYDDTFAWYNLGSVFVKLGNYEQAAIAFDAARERILPWRMYWYQFDLYEAYYQVGRYEDVLILATFTSDTENYPESEEAHYYEGLVYAARGQTVAARNAFNKALSYNPTYQAAQIALGKLDS